MHVYAYIIICALRTPICAYVYLNATHPLKRSMRLIIPETLYALEVSTQYEYNAQ